jgi:tetratricopeptide (TPR) repeat protein
LLTLFLLPPPLAAANAAQAGGGHILYGDFRIEEAKAPEGGAAAELTPATFHILLYTAAGQLVSRQPITNNGRYRFLDVPNGEYDLVVELENDQLARVRVQLAYSYRTDHRQDILMESRPAPEAGGAASGARTVSAAELYRRPAGSDALFRKAARAVERGEYEEALALLRRVVAADPKDYVAWSQLGTLLTARREYAEAEQAYGRSLAARPDYATALVNLGRLRMAQKNFAGAIEALARAVEAQPRSAAAHYLLGESLLQVKKGSRAVVHLNEAIRLDPVGRAEAHLRLALLYNAAGLKDRAAAEYEQFLAKNPGHPDRKKFEQYIAENRKR